MSYLGRFSRATKEMTPANRVDLLSDAALHYAAKKSAKLGMCSIIAAFL